MSGSAQATKSEGGVPRSPEERVKLTRILSQPSFSSLLCLPPLTPSLTPFDSILPIETLRSRLSLAHLPLRLGRRREDKRWNNGFGKRAEILKSWICGEGESVQNPGRDHKLPDRVKDGVPVKSTATKDHRMSVSRDTWQAGPSSRERTRRYRGGTLGLEGRSWDGS